MIASVLCFLAMVSWALPNFPEPVLMVANASSCLGWVLASYTTKSDCEQARKRKLKEDPAGHYQCVQCD